MGHKKKNKQKSALQSQMVNDIDSVKVLNRNSAAASAENVKKAKESVSAAKAEKSNSVVTKTSYPKRLTVASSNWRALKEKLRINEVDKKESKSSKNFSSEKSFQRKSATEPIKREPEVWFDGVDKALIETPFLPSSSSGTSNGTEGLVKKGSSNKLTRTVAMDCEMVGIGSDGQDSALARVSIVNLTGHCIYDKFVKSREEVTDYRTAVSGVRKEDLENAEEFETVQKEVSEILNGRILVGHAVHHDLKVLYLSHPKKRIRDTSRFKPFKDMFGGRTPSLKKLCQQVVGVKVQEGEHSSVQDAQAAMRLYTMYRRKWEHMVASKSTPKKVGSQS